VTQPKPSKTARKREQLELQQLGERLIELTPEELQALPIEERLREAVLAATKIRSHGALRRQKQLIGKLMRSCDPEPIRQALEARGAEDRRAKRVFADTEWRLIGTARGTARPYSECAKRSNRKRAAPPAVPGDPRYADGRGAG
jgi:ribosomal 50S subunit-associated protein YjgA (DUF615 family)